MYAAGAYDRPEAANADGFENPHAETGGRHAAEHEDMPELFAFASETNV